MQKQDLFQEPEECTVIIQAIGAVLKKVTKRLDMNKTSDFEKIDINKVNPANMPKEISESLILFHYTIKKHIGEI